MKKFLSVFKSFVYLSLLGFILYFVVDNNQRNNYITELSEERDSLFLQNVRKDYMIQTFSGNNPEYDVFDVAVEANKLKMKR